MTLIAPRCRAISNIRHNGCSCLASTASQACPAALLQPRWMNPLTPLRPPMLSGSKCSNVSCRALLGLAGIWQDADHKGDARPSFLIVTEEPNDFIRPYHDRMPLVLDDDRITQWLDLSQAVQPDPSMLLPLDRFHVRPMHKAMNRSAEKDLDAIDPEAAAVRASLRGVVAA
ncbi:SOS response-associated peptidase family protein [Lichenihabitans sp. Uapishka_5]|uniref:SOS response-associated peptidase family protein n=1 Tax=Lichenihabitans sp. Uapishka_5 TaxID=3037302 RepID=UPI0029E7D86E|nr:SOS response-associated peptidase family protein [Lichenihabitans sp. Uapishka_5]MDX7951781.1 SOS response-associated peptidase family protein [Lichenihabitans sp. Uapishka_5]